MRTAEELLREFADNPAGLAGYAVQLQQQLAQARQEQVQTQEQLALQAQQLAQAQASIADLKRELFGAKSDQLNEEQEEQLRQLCCFGERA